MRVVRIIIRNRKEMRRDEDCFVEVERDANIFFDLFCSSLAYIIALESLSQICDEAEI